MATKLREHVEYPLYTMNIQLPTKDIFSRYCLLSASGSLQGASTLPLADKRQYLEKRQFELLQKN